MLKQLTRVYSRLLLMYIFKSIGYISLSIGIWQTFLLLKVIGNKQRGGVLLP